MEAGFSLIELMVAMVVTLIVTGAIYGLVATGKSAFRREPELTDRQQNIRIAMSMIEQDIESAGMSLPPFTQAFAPNGDGVGPNGEDALEIIISPPGCPMTRLCVRQPDAGQNMVVESSVDLPVCFGAPAGSGQVQLGAVFFQPGFAVIGPVTNLGADPVCQISGGPSNVGTQMTLRFDSGPAYWRTLSAGVPAPGVPAIQNVDIVPVQVIRYEIAPDPNDPQYPNNPNFRNLWRSVTAGRSQANGNWANVAPPPGPAWQLVARGIQDLQVQYVEASGAALDEPQLLALTTDFDKIVRQVNVTLSARVAGAMIAGFSGINPDDPAQMRLAQLRSQISPRAALVALQSAPAAFQWK
jgi:prepilin-type N-terminal cleavage/methylation domain-containing protein